MKKFKALNARGQTSIHRTSDKVSSRKRAALFARLLLTMRIMRIDCGCCLLRRWSLEDVPSLVHHANNYKVWKHMRDSFPHPYTRADAEQWLSFVHQQNPQTYFAVEVKGAAVGGIGLELKSDVERCSAEIGYWLGEAVWGKGIATAAVQGLTRYGFKVFSLTRIFAVPFANNPGSMHVLKNAGYVREGVMRRSAVKEGIVLDQVLYAITDKEGLAPTES